MVKTDFFAAHNSRNERLNINYVRRLHRLLVYVVDEGFAVQRASWIFFALVAVSLAGRQETVLQLSKQKKNH